MTDLTEGRRNALGVLMPGFVGSSLPGWLRSLLEEGLGGVCLFAHNVDSPAQVAELTAAIHTANPLAIVSIDEEGGDVSRLHQRDGSPFPGNAVLGRLDDLEATRRVGHGVGVVLARVGVDLTLAPDADVNSDPDNPVIGVRSFGAEPSAVAAHTAAWTNGVQTAGVAACAKHFPGHGDTSADSHLAVPLIDVDAGTLKERELVPFVAAIDAGTKTIMTSHIRVPALDAHSVATFSTAILDDLLRRELGFDGVVVTDALDMVGASGDIGIPAAAVRSVAAGCDLLCLGSNNPENEVSDIIDALVEADRDGRIPPGRLAVAAARCRDLAGWSAERRAPYAEAANEPDPIIDLDRVASTFTLSDRATEAMATGDRRIQWVEIAPERNIAVGETPLGPFFDGGAVPSLVVPVDDRSSAHDFVADPGALTLVIGRELHRDHTALAAATAIADRFDSLIVDMGYAHSDRIDIATFGASRLVGQALIELMGAAG